MVSRMDTNFPQLVRYLSGLLRAPEGGALGSPAGPAEAAPGLQESVERAAPTREYLQALLAVAVLRSVRQFDPVGGLRRPLTNASAAWQRVRVNEGAALAWRRDDSNEAAASGRDQVESVPVYFNRGMAALFLGRPAEAGAPLGQAASQLHENGA
jgi:hypothetical protein